MAKYEVEYYPRAVRDLEALSPDVALRIATRTKTLEQNPLPRGDTVKRLQGYDAALYRLRVGDWRVIFRTSPPRIYVLRIAHRSELDRALRDLLNTN